jgi:hypothetical protein
MKTYHKYGECYAETEWKLHMALSHNNAPNGSTDCRLITKCETTGLIADQNITIVCDTVAMSQ